TGGWDCTPPEGADRFITPDLQRGRLIDVIQRGQPAIMVSHWTGIYWNGQELGFKIMQEVVSRIRQRFENVLWMKLSEVARYWAAKELTRVERQDNIIAIQAPFACPNFTVAVHKAANLVPQLHSGAETTSLEEVSRARQLASGKWFREGDRLTICFGLARGAS